MAGLRLSSRRLRRFCASPAARIVAICAILIFGIRFVIRHNHDRPARARVPRAARPTASVGKVGIDWSKLYYVQYVTSPEYLCNALMVWSEIEEIGSRAQRMMFYPSSWSVDDVEDGLPTPIARLLRTAETDYFVKLQPVTVMHQSGTAEETWADSYTKLLAFNLTGFDRVLAIDSDSMVLKNLDEVFLLPAAPVAMPYVYWGEPVGWQYSSQMMLIKPSSQEFAKIEAAVSSAKSDEYDMDIINRLYEGKVMTIAQRPFNLLSGEFRRRDHRQYLGSSTRKWNPDAILQEAKFLHFSDWPIPKPWMRAPQYLLNKYMPKCSQILGFGATDCRDRAIWFKLYYDFALRRKAVCGVGFELQSQVLPQTPQDLQGSLFHTDDEAA